MNREGSTKELASPRTAKDLADLYRTLLTIQATKKDAEIDVVVAGVRDVLIRHCEEFLRCVGDK